MKKRILSLLLVFCMLLTLLPTAAFATNASGNGAAEERTDELFADVKKGDWFYDAVRYVSANGIFNGTGENAFSPNESMTRAMFVTVLGRLAGIDPADYSGPTGFDDVPEDAWYAPYVKWAVQFGITLGIGDGKFAPEEEIDRSQMAVFFVRYFETFEVDYETGAEITTEPADLDSVPDYAKDAVLKLWKQGLLNGDGVNFAPAEKASRAQVATLSQRVDETVETWYSEPGVPSERESVDPDAQQPEQSGQDKAPSGGSSSGSSSSGGSSSGGTTTTKYYSVQFALGDGQQAAITLPTTQTVAENTAISSLPTPFKSGVIFLGWYYDSALTKAVETGDKVDKNMTLYAKTAAGDAVQSIETPNYITKTNVDAAEPFTFSVIKEDGTVSENDIKFINVTGGNIAVDFTLSSNTVTATLEAGQTYQVELLNDAVRFVIDNETQGEAIRYLNILTAKDTVTNAELNKSVEELSLGSIGGLDPNAFNGLFIADETSSIAENDTIGTFTSGKELSIGDTVAIKSADADLTSVTSTGGDVAYLKITGKSGNSAPYTYTYEMAEVEDVLLIPDVLPIESTWDTDGDANNNSITITAENLDTAMSNVDAARLDKGDFLGFLANGKTYSTAESAASYGKITDFTTDSDGNYVITYDSADEAAIESALDVYYSQDQEITLTEEEQTQIKDEIKVEVQESGYAQQAAGYIAALMLESNNLSTVPDMDAVEARLDEIEPYILATGTSVQMDGGDKVSVGFDKTDINVTLLLNSQLKHLSGNGFKVQINIPFTVTIGSGDNAIQIDITATFEEEIILRQNISTKRHKTGFLKYDYSLNASFEVGNYTGIGFTADIKTASNEEDKSMIEKLDAIMDRMEAYHDAGGVTTTGGEMEGLAEIYQGVMDNANDAWIDIVNVKLFETNGNAFFHIFCWQIRGSFVVSANLAVSLGMSFEYITQKQYNFSVRVKAKTSTNETIDIITPEYNFDFYVVGTIGIRAGIRLEMYVGLFSLKLDKIGITAEAGAYARLWGYFFYHLKWQENAGKTENSAGAMFIEIGMYLDINFLAQLLNSSRLTWNPTIYSNEWPLWSAGEQQNVYAFANADDDSYTLTAVRELTLPTSTFDMSYMDLKSGDTGTVNKDSDKGGTDEEYFTVSFSNSEDFSYNAATNTVTVGQNASSTGDETEMTITWQKAALAFTSTPIQKTIHISWSNPDNVRYLSFNSVGGSVVDTITGNAGQSIDLTTVTVPTKQGYTFEGWHKYPLYSDEKQTTVTLPAEDSDNKGVTLYAKWTPNENTRYTVEYYTEELDGSYSLTTEELKGTTDARTNVTATAPGFTTRTIAQQYIDANGSTVVKVYFDRDHYKLTFKSGYTDGEKDITQSYKYGAEVFAPTFTREGYTFTGWNYAFEINDYGDPIATESRTYTAKWTANSNTITFDSTGGSAVTSATVKTDEKITKPTDPTREGYTFKGWYTDQDCVKAWNFESDKVTGSMTLYAKWQGGEYNVTFNANGGTPSTTTRLLTFGEAYGSLPTPRRDGYAFDGWYTEATGGTKVEATTIVATASAHTLYAHWRAGEVNYKVEHWLQNIDNDEYTLYETDSTVSGKTGELTAAAAKTYTGFTPKSFEQQTIAADGETVVKIYYDREKYTVTWVTDGDALTGTYTSGEVKYGTEIKAPAATKAQTDTHTYTFDGWYTAETDGTKVTSFGTVTGEVTYYARFTETARIYNIRYYFNADDGGINDDSNPATYTWGVGVASFANATLKGFDFGGWYTDNYYPESAKVTSISSTATGDVELCVKWIRHFHNLTWDVNGGDELTGNDYTKGSVGYDTSITPPTPTRTGYTFTGWDKDVPSTMPDNDLSFTAQWEINKYPVTFEIVGSGDPIDPQTVEHGKTVSPVTTSITGYSLKYYTDAGCTAEYDLATPVTDELTLYVKWTPNTYTVTFDANGGTVSTASKEVTYDSTYGELPRPTHSDSDSDSVFDGWFTEQDGGSEVKETTDVKITADQTLFAHWRENTVTTYTYVQILGESIRVNDDGSVVGYPGVTYDDSTKTLTLKDVTISSDKDNEHACAIYMSSNKYTIRVEGENTISYSRADNAGGIYSTSSLTFTGTGTLTVAASIPAGKEGNYDNTYAINAFAVTIDGPTVVASAGEASSTSYGVWVSTNTSYPGSICVKSGSLTAQGYTCAVGTPAFVDADGNTLSVTASANYDGSDATTDVTITTDTYKDYKYLTVTVPKGTD